MAQGKRSENAAGEQVETPRGFDGRVGDALGQCDVKRDEEDIGHRQFAQDVERGLDPWVQHIPLDQRSADGFDVGREEGEDGDYQREEDVGFPQGLEPGDDAYFAETEDRQ